MKSSGDKELGSCPPFIQEHFNTSPFAVHSGQAWPQGLLWFDGFVPQGMWAVVMVVNGWSLYKLKPWGGGAVSLKYGLAAGLSLSVSLWCSKSSEAPIRTEVMLTPCPWRSGLWAK